jgi:predicted MPP superfamily phosphohydrolase
MKISRREFLKKASKTLASTAASTSLAIPVANLIVATEASATLTKDSKAPETSRIDLNFADLPADLNGFKIAFLSDTHLGHYLSTSYLKKIVAQVNSETPDLIILGGDYIWREKSNLAKAFIVFQESEYHSLSGKKLVEKILEDTIEIFRELKAKDGVYGVLGNHDQWEVGPNVKKLFAEAQSSTILINEVAEISRGDSRLNILGVDDYWTGIPKVPASWRAPEAKSFNLLVAHNPDYISEIVERSTPAFNLALCGHTHGGQIKLPLFGSVIHNIYDARFIEGLVSLRPNKQYVFTTRGIGTVELPFRYNCPPEIAIITLNSI